MSSTCSNRRANVVVVGDVGGDLESWTHCPSCDRQDGLSWTRSSLPSAARRRLRPSLFFFLLFLTFLHRPSFRSKATSDGLSWLSGRWKGRGRRRNGMVSPSFSRPFRLPQLVDHFPFLFLSASDKQRDEITHSTRPQPQPRHYHDHEGGRKELWCLFSLSSRLVDCVASHCSPQPHVSLLT